MLGDALRRAGRAGEARPLIQSAMAWRQTHFGPADPRTIEARQALEATTTVSQHQTCPPFPPVSVSPDHRGNLMRRLSFAVALFAAVAVIGCVKDTSDRSEGHGRQTAREAGRAGRLTPASDRKPAGRDQPRVAATEAPDVCALLSAKEIEEIAGVPIERAEKKPNGCEWYANAAAQQQKGADTARGTFASLMKEEPKSAQDGVKTMRKPDEGPRWRGRAEQAAVRRSGSAGERRCGGGHAEDDRSSQRRRRPAEGSNRSKAWATAHSSVPWGRSSTFERATRLITLGSMTTREQAIALARRLVPRIE